MATTPGGSQTSPAKWNALNSYNMQKAKALSRDILKQIRDNEAAERASKDASMEQVEREKQRKREDVFAKAAAHGEVISTSSTCMRNIEDATLQTDNSLSLLKQERALAFASLQVCKRRLQLREKRPTSELIQDAVHDALESEKTLLEKSRDEFLEMEDLGRKIAEELRKMRAHLSQDTGERRLVMKHDQQSLKPQVNAPPVPGVEQRAPPPISEDESRKMLSQTFHLLERSSQHRQKTGALVKRIKEDSRVALVKVDECLEKHVDHLTVLEKELTQHMKDCETAISVSERSLDKSQKRMDPDDTSKKEKLTRDGRLLDQLRKHKAILHSEIQNKFLALQIDNSCRRVTPVKACEITQDELNAMVNKPNSNLALRNSSSSPSLLQTAGTSNVNFKSPSFGGSKSFSSSGVRSSAHGKK
jgi:hypothetical protein